MRAAYAALQPRARPPADVLLPAPRLGGAAADHGHDHGAERVERVLVPLLRRQQLSRRDEAADLGGARRPVRVDRLAAAAPLDPPARLARLLRLADAAADDGLHGRRAQRQPELAGPGPGRHPALRDRQARPDPVGRARLRAQGPPPAQPARDHVPGRARHARGHRPGRVRQRPGHGPRALRDPARHALGGRRPGPLLRAVPEHHGRRGLRPGPHEQRADGPHHQLHRPVPRLPRHRLAARARPLRALQRRLVRRGHRREPPEVGRPARGAHRLHLRRARRGARPARHPADDHALPHHRVRRGAGRPAQHRRLHPLHDLRHRRLAARPDDDQRRHGAGAAAGDRHPAAARVLRRLGPRAVPGGARPADRLRPPRAAGRRRAGGPSPQPVGRAVGGSRLVPLRRPTA